MNPVDAQFCANCGVRVVGQTGVRGEIVDLVANVNEPHVPLETTPALAAQPPPPLNPPPPGPPPTKLGPPVLDAPFPTSTRTTAVLAIVAVATVLITLIGVVIGILLVMRGPNGTDDIATSQAPPTEQGHTTIDAGTISGATPTATVAPTGTTTTVPLDPAAIPPAPPEPGPINAPGSPQVLATQQPSGLWFFEVEESFRLAQSFSDALALDRWPEARLIDPGLTKTSDADFIAGYGNTDQVSLMLLDARQNGPTAHELLIVSVAVEFGGSRTSLYCLNWAVNTETNTIDQQGGGLITTWQGVNAQPEAIRDDPAALATVATCTWP
jgi:hypothetical protein